MGHQLNKLWTANEGMLWIYSKLCLLKEFLMTQKCAHDIMLKEREQDATLYIITHSARVCA